MTAALKEQIQILKAQINCPLCFESMVREGVSPMSMTTCDKKCAYVACCICLNNWAGQNKGCPNCRKLFNARDLKKDVSRERSVKELLEVRAKLKEIAASLSGTAQNTPPQSMQGSMPPNPPVAASSSAVAPASRELLEFEQEEKEDLIKTFEEIIKMQVAQLDTCWVKGICVIRGNDEIEIWKNVFSEVLKKEPKSKVWKDDAECSLREDCDPLILVRFYSVATTLEDVLNILKKNHPQSAKRIKDTIKQRIQGTSSSSSAAVASQPTVQDSAISVEKQKKMEEMRAAPFDKSSLRKVMHAVVADQNLAPWKRVFEALGVEAFWSSKVKPGSHPLFRIVHHTEIIITLGDVEKAIRGAGMPDIADALIAHSINDQEMLIPEEWERFECEVGKKTLQELKFEAWHLIDSLNPADSQLIENLFVTLFAYNPDRINPNMINRLPMFFRASRPLSVFIEHIQIEYPSIGIMHFASCMWQVGLRDFATQLLTKHVE